MERKRKKRETEVDAHRSTGRRNVKKIEWNKPCGTAEAETVSFLRWNGVLVCMCFVGLVYTSLHTTALSQQHTTYIFHLWVGKSVRVIHTNRIATQLATLNAVCWITKRGVHHHRIAGRGLFVCNWNWIQLPSPPPPPPLPSPHGNLRLFAVSIFHFPLLLCAVVVVASNFSPFFFGFVVEFHFLFLFCL